MKYVSKFSNMKNKIENEGLRNISFAVEDLMTKFLYQRYGKDKVQTKFSGTSVFESVSAERKDDSIEVLNNKISAALFAEAYKRYGGTKELVFDLGDTEKGIKGTFLPDAKTKQIIADKNLWSSPVFRDSFAVVYETAITPMAQTLAVGFYDGLTKITNIGWGDSYAVDVESNEVLTVSELGQDTLKVHSQTLHNKTYTAVPKPYGAATSINFYHMASGKLDWGKHIFKIAQAFVTYWNLMAINSMTKQIEDVTTKGTVDSDYFKITLNDDNVTRLIKLLTAANNDGRINIYGDLTMVNQLLPTTDANNAPILSQIGEEWIKRGYISRYLGCDVYKIDQIILPGTKNANPLFGAPENILWFMNDIEAPLHLVFGGNTMSIDRNHMETGDGMLKFGVISNFDMVFVPSSKFGAIIVQ